MDSESLYNALLNSGFSEKELENEIHKKTVELGDFITADGILFLLAKEYGLPVNAEEADSIMDHNIEHEIDYNEFTVPLKDIKENMSQLVILGRIEKVLGIREFTRKDLSHGMVGSFYLNDGTKCVKIILWDNHTQILKQHFFQVYEVIRLIGGYSKLNKLTNEIEIHLSKKGKISLNLLPIELNRFPHLKALLSSPHPNNNTFKRKMVTISGNITKSIKLWEKTKKDGSRFFILNFEIESEQEIYTINAFGMRAIEILEKIKEGLNICLSNIVINYNSYSNREELYIIKNSKLEII